MCRLAEWGIKCVNYTYIHPFLLSSCGAECQHDLTSPWKNSYRNPYWHSDCVEEFAIPIPISFHLTASLLFSFARTNEYELVHVLGGHTNECWYVQVIHKLCGVLKCSSVQALQLATEVDRLVCFNAFHVEECTVSFVFVWCSVGPYFHPGRIEVKVRGCTSRSHGNTMMVEGETRWEKFLVLHRKAR